MILRTLTTRWILIGLVLGLLALPTGCDETGVVDGDAQNNLTDTSGGADTSGTDATGTDTERADTRLAIDIPEQDANGTDSAGADTEGGTDSNQGETTVLGDASSDGVGGADSSASSLQLNSINPNSGPSTGETISELRGAGFTETIEVYFGAGKSPGVNFVTDRKIEVVVPSGTAGTVDVKVVTEDASAVLSDGYTYVDAISIDRIDPERSPTRGGVPFALYGSGFTADALVSIGGRSAIDVQLVSETELVGITPPGVLGAADVRVTSEAGTALAPELLTYYEPTRIDAIFPSAGPTAGGTEVDIEGAGFTGQLDVTFGNKPATVISVGLSSIKVRTPAQPAGPRDVVVQSDDGVAFVPGGFTYFTASGSLQVFDVTPDSGPLSGGNAVVISGQNLDAANLTVMFGAVSATPSVVTAESIRLDVPAGAGVGAVDVSVSNDAGSGTLTAAYTYFSDFQLDSVTPNSGPVAGGTTVTLLGAGFAGSPVVYFGPLAATSVQVKSDTELEVVTPSGSGGSVDVAVRLQDGREAMKADGFFYTDVLAVFALIPNRGSQAGASVVTVAGKGFAPGAEVYIDGLAGLNVQVLDPATLSFVTPAHPPGIVEVSVTQGSETAISPVPFTFYDPGSFAGGGWGNAIEGTVNISVYAYGGGGPVEGAYVMLSTDNGTPYQGVADVNGQITFSGVGVFGNQTVSASAVDYTSATITTIDAENITIYLQYLKAPPGDPPPGRAPGTISGNITGAAKLGLDTNANLIPYSLVITTQLHPFDPNPDYGSGNQVVGDGFYTLTSRLGDIAVVGLCGALNTQTGEFEPRMMAMRRFLFVEEGGQYNVDLNCTIALKETATFKYIGSPLGQGPTHNILLPYLNIGPEGYIGGFWLEASTEDTIIATNLAPLDGPLAGMSYYMLMGAFDYSTGELGTPYSIQHREVLTDLSLPIEIKPLISIPQMVTPTEGGLVQNGHFEWTMTSPASDIDFYNPQLMEPTFPPTPIWEVFLPGSSTSFDIPAFIPSAGAAEPYSGFAILSWDIIKTKGPFNYDKFTLNDRGLDRRLSWVTTSNFVILP